MLAQDEERSRLAHELLARWRKLDQDAAFQALAMGAVLHSIREHGLWKELGALTWQTFLSKHLEIERTWALGLIRAHLAFGHLVSERDKIPPMTRMIRMASQMRGASPSEKQAALRCVADMPAPVFEREYPKAPKRGTEPLATRWACAMTESQRSEVNAAVEHIRAEFPDLTMGEALALMARSYLELYDTPERAAS